MREQVIVNNDITLQRVLAILLCVTVVLIPISLCWLFSLRSPTDTINGSITNKRSALISNTNSRGTWKHVYYVTIDTREFQVSGEMYKRLHIGDYISAAYRRKTLYYYA